MGSGSTSSHANMREKLSKLFDFIERVVSSRKFLWFVFIWFVLQALFFAVFVRFDIPPDENYHLTYIKLFAENFPSPFLSSQGDNFILREAIRNPFFLYHYLLSLPYFFMKGYADAYIVLRIVNLAFGVGSLAIILALAKRMRMSALVTNVGLMMTACTLMFSFLFGSINYDSLYVLLTLMSILFLLRLLEKVTARDALLLVNTLLAGSLVKINFLPQIAIVCFILIAKYARTYRQAWAKIPASFQRHKKLNILLVAIACFLSILFVHRYVYNIAKYQTYAPDCARIQTVEYCRNSALYARNEKVFGPNRPAPTHDTLRYVSEWTALMQNRSYGVFGHLRFLPNKAIGMWMDVLLVVSICAVIRYWRPRDKVITTVLVICLFNVVALILENYRIYARSGIIELAVHGRYLFAFLPLLYLVSMHYVISNMKNQYVRVSFIVVTLFVFLLASLPSFIIKADDTWYTSKIERVRVLVR